MTERQSPQQQRHHHHSRLHCWSPTPVTLLVLLLTLTTLPSLLLTPAHGASPPATLDVTLFSFSLVTPLPKAYQFEVGEDATESVLWNDLQKNIAQLVGADNIARVYDTDLEYVRVADPYPDIIDSATLTTNSLAPTSLPPRLQALSTREHQSLSFATGDSVTEIATPYAASGSLSLEIPRVSLCFLPTLLDGTVMNAASTQTYITTLTQLFDEYHDSNGQSGGLLTGNATQYIHPLVTIDIANVTLTLCSWPETSYRQVCPVKDPKLYWGATGLLVACLVAVGIFVTVFLVVWCAWTLQLNRRHRRNAAAARPDKRHILEGEHNTKFKQHQLDTWQPLWTHKNITACMCVTGLCVLLPLGIYFQISSDDLHVISVDYDDLPQCRISDTQLTKTCLVDIPIDRDMSAPIYFYYGLTNFYQNHRNYVMSRSDAQLRNQGGKGSSSAPSIDTECAALKTFDSYPSAYTQPFYPFNSSTKSALNSKTLYPCGLIAASFFTDRYLSARVTSDRIQAAKAASSNNTYPGPGPEYFVLQGLNWDNTNIAWRNDRVDRYKLRNLDTSRETNLNPFGIAPQYRTGNDSVDYSPSLLPHMTLPPVDNEDFIIWMRVSPFSTFQKLNHKIQERDLKKGEIVQVTVEVNYDVRAYKGKKSVLLATMNNLGGKNEFYGATYLLFACLYTITGLVIFILHRHDAPPLSHEDALQIALEVQAKEEIQHRGTAVSIASPQVGYHSSVGYHTNGTPNPLLSSQSVATGISSPAFSPRVYKTHAQTMMNVQTNPKLFLPKNNSKENLSGSTMES